MLDGALTAGLEVDQDPGSPIYGLDPDFHTQLENGRAVDPTLLGAIEDAALPKAPREPGPSNILELSEAAMRRWHSAPEDLPERKLYRPVTLKGVETALAAGPQLPQKQTVGLPVPEGDKPTPGAFYRIRFGDGLRAIALHAYGHADREDIIMQANPIIVDHDRIYEGQVILLPPAPAAPVAQSPAT